MELINSFLAKFLSLQSPELLVRKATHEVIQNVLGVPVVQGCISFQKNQITIQGSPTIKQAIYLQKESLLIEIKKQLPESIVVRDIR